jgi:hypothetical protein
VYQGVGNPSVHPFFCDLRKELNRLNPKTVLPPGETREVTVIVRAFIADAPARAWQCCIKLYSGYYSCPRCKIRGCHPKKVDPKKPDPKKPDPKKPDPKKPGPKNTDQGKDQTNVIFPEVGKDDERLFSEWPTYFEPPRGEKQNMAHRTGPTPLDKIIDVNPINDVPLEEMHVMDLGVYKQMPEILLSLKAGEGKPKKRGPRTKNSVVAGYKRKKMPKILPARLHAWSHRIRIWSKLTPKEFGRKVSSLEYFSQWKANEYRQFFLYYFIPLAVIDKKTVNEQGLEAICNVNRAARLVAGNTHKEVPKHRVEEGKKLLCTAFYQMKHLCDCASCAPKWHWMWHMLDDCLRFRCHLGSLSAYCFENQMIHFRRMGLTGTNVIQQVTNRLSERCLAHDLDHGDQYNFDAQSFACFFEKIKRNHTSPEMTVTQVLDLLQFFVHDFNAKRQIVKCESFTITNKLPDNVVRLHFKGESRRRKNAFVVDTIFRDSLDGELKVYAREFVKLTNTFEKPYASSKIGNFFATGGLKTDDLEGDERQAVPFSRIIGKYFAFPTILMSRDENNKYNPRDVNQTWILQEIMHSN